MAKMVEIKYRAKLSELAKISAKLERLNKSYEKKYANAVKYGVSEMDSEAHNAWLATVPHNEEGWILDKEAVKRNGAWWDLYMVSQEIKDAEHSLEVAEKAFDKAQEALDRHNKELDALTDAKSKEELRRLEFEQEQKEWAKDGIVLEHRYFGTTPKGKRFLIERNHGVTERSWHCFTLYLDGETIFTSGEFWRAYIIIKQN